MRWTEEEFNRALAENPSLRVQDGRPKTITETTRANIAQERPNFGSQAEERYYDRYILPGLASRYILSCECHRSFVIMDAVTHCGTTYKERVYTPDFFVEYLDGATEVVEVKGKAVKKNQRDYPLRRHAFILRYCKPNGWRFREVKAEEL